MKLNIEKKIYNKLVELVELSDRQTLTEVCKYMLDRLWVVPKEREAMIDRIGLSNLKFITGVRVGRPVKEKDLPTEKKPALPKKSAAPKSAQKPEKPAPARKPAGKPEDDEQILKELEAELKDIEDTDAKIEANSDSEKMMK
ncbi:MAG: hypothetical protein MUP55_03305 [Candidatus Aenigmarchaeota archaeon]|nr:hypothetical protein [Candidatus Aenigmarchaeota archaeon]